MLGIEVSQATVAKYMIRPRRPPSQTWRAFLNNHAKELASVDFFTVPTATFRILYVCVVLRHERREVVHFNVTEHLTAPWTAQQVVEAFPWDEAPKYLLRDRDTVYGAQFRRRVRSLGIKEVLIAPRSPWQSPYVERLIGSIRRECLDHVIVFNERHLRRLLRSYFAYYRRARTHLALAKQCPQPRTVQPRELGEVPRLPPRRRSPSRVSTRCLIFRLAGLAGKYKDECHQWMRCSASVRRLLLELREFAAPRTTDPFSRISDACSGLLLMK